MNKTRFSPIVISGPSGAGKSELINYIEKNNNLFSEAYGLTTRKKREFETGKMSFVDYDFFNQQIKNNSLIEYCLYNGNYYGVSKEEFKKLDEKYVIFNVSYSSAKIIKKIYEDAYMIYLLPPNKQELLRRLGEREQNRYYLGIKETEQYACLYDYLLISLTNDFEHTYYNFLDIINQNASGYKQKILHKNNYEFIKKFYV